MSMCCGLFSCARRTRTGGGRDPRPPPVLPIFPIRSRSLHRLLPGVLVLRAAEHLGGPAGDVGGGVLDIFGAGRDRVTRLVICVGRGTLEVTAADRVVLGG